jgi:hypothetical protein
MLSYILGALMQLVQPGAWVNRDPTTLRQMTDLIGNIGTAALTSYGLPTPISNGDASCNWVRNTDGKFILFE